MAPPLVSILIPAYNAARTLAETLGSAATQTWHRIEIIVVDDGSTDHTREVARAFESRSVKVVTQPNAGAAAARNRALRDAQGDFIQWLDADDLLAPDKISRQLAAARADGADVVHAAEVATFYRRPEGARPVANALCRDREAADWLITALGTGEWLAPHAWLVSRTLTERAGPWDERLSLNDDGEYFCRVVSSGKMVKFHRAARCFYRIGNAQSLSRVRSPRALESLWQSVTLSIEHLLRLEDGARGRQAAVAFLQYIVDRFGVAEPDLWRRFQVRARALGGDVRPPFEPVRLRVARRLLGRAGAETLRAAVTRAKGEFARALERCRAVSATPGAARRSRP